MSAPVLPKERMKVGEFLTWSARQPDDRYELADGEIVAITRDTVRHNRTKAAAWRALEDAVRAAALPCVVLIDGVGVAVNDKTLRIPDVLVQCGTELDPDSMIVESPLIVVEVVSPSSERDDTDTKLVEYFSVPSIRHYLIIFSEKRVVVHHRRNDGGDIATRIAHDGDVTLDPPRIVVPVLALLGPSSVRGVGGQGMRTHRSAQQERT
jgi:Uma2 family endonuclease